MKRTTEFIGSYDHITTPCAGGCDHGQHCDEWRYTVIAEGGAYALTLEVFAGNYPRGGHRPPTGAMLIECRAPTGKADERVHVCPHLTGRGCVRSSSCGPAAAFYEEHGLPYSDAEARAHNDSRGVPIQSEVFWLELERLAAEWSQR